ncbi:MAG: hypothetical protein Q9208_000400 [Pyrenodesmia sp. 3 TL-2023]
MRLEPSALPLRFPTLHRSIIYNISPPTTPKAPTPTPSQAPGSLSDPDVEPSDGVSAAFGSASPPTPEPDVPGLPGPLLSALSLVELSLSPSLLSSVAEVTAPLVVVLEVVPLADVGDDTVLESIEVPDITLDGDVMAEPAIAEPDASASLAKLEAVGATAEGRVVTRLEDTPSAPLPAPPCRRWISRGLNCLETFRTRSSSKAGGQEAYICNHEGCSIEGGDEGQC